jgi:hypothetical protein
VSVGGLAEAALAVSAGIALAAAAGLRVFVPLLAVSAAAFLGHLDLAPGAAWLGTAPALVTLCIAAGLEVGAYFVPALDHALDALATPLAVVAGIVVSAALFTGMPAYLRWALALIAGGGSAGLVQGATTLVRLKSGLLTAGLANPLVAVAELAGALVLALLALLVPLLALALAVGLVLAAFRLAKRVAFGRGAAAAHRPSAGLQAAGTRGQ